MTAEMEVFEVKIGDDRFFTRDASETIAIARRRFEGYDVFGTVHRRSIQVEEGKDGTTKTLQELYDQSSHAPVFVEEFSISISVDVRDKSFFGEYFDTPEDRTRYAMLIDLCNRVESAHPSANTEIAGHPKSGDEEIVLVDWGMYDAYDTDGIDEVRKTMENWVFEHDLTDVYYVDGGVNPPSNHKESFNVSFGLYVKENC